jgi:uncharacterized membrane protein YdcZ (DUF606 family)
MIIAVAAGVSFVVSAERKLPHTLNSGAWFGFMSYLVGMICTAPFRTSRAWPPVPSVSAVARIPWWVLSLSGGPVRRYRHRARHCS